MIRILSLLLALLLAPAVTAQTWQPALSDDGRYAYGFANAEGLPMAIGCVVRSAQNRPLESEGILEVQPSAPYAMRIELWGNAIPADGRQSRGDIVLWVNDTGFQLPLVTLDEFYGYWWTELSMGDPLFAALGTAERLVLAIGQQSAWSVPVAGLAAATAQAQQHCAATLIATGFPPPPWFGTAAAPAQPAIPAAPAAPAVPPSAAAPTGALLSGPFTVPQQVIGHANFLCEGNAVLAPDAIMAGDLDGDGVPDVVLDWNHITCPPPMLPRAFCGAANCSVDVFLSSRGYTNPEQLLGIGPNLVALADGRIGLGLSGSMSMCGQSGEHCQTPLLWDGIRLSR